MTRKFLLLLPLSSIVFDLIRYHLLNEGLDLCFVHSGLMLANPTWRRAKSFVRKMATSITLHRISSSNLSDHIRASL